MNKDKSAWTELEAIREDFGLTIKAFCKLLGIKRSTYYAYKSTRNPSETLKIMIDLIKDDPEGTLGQLRKRERAE